MKFVVCRVYSGSSKGNDKILLFPRGTKEEELAVLSEEDKNRTYIVRKSWWNDKMSAVKLGHRKCAMGTNAYACSAKKEYKEIAECEYPLCLCE